MNKKEEERERQRTGLDLCFTFPFLDYFKAKKYKLLLIYFLIFICKLEK